MLVFFSSHYPVTIFYFFFFNDTATTEIYTLSLHDALPISLGTRLSVQVFRHAVGLFFRLLLSSADRKSTRLNSSHMSISYAVFCLKKKKPKHTTCLPLPQTIKKTSDIAYSSSRSTSLSHCI